MTAHAVMEWDNAIRTRLIGSDRVDAMERTAYTYAMRAARALTEGDLFAAQDAADLAVFGMREVEIHRRQITERETRRIRAGTAD